MMDERMHVALHCPVAAGGIRVDPTARLDGEVSGFLHRLHGEIARRVDDHRALAAHPGDNGWPVFVVVPPTGLALLAAPTRATAQGFLPALMGLALLPSGVIEVIRFHRALQLTLHLIGERGLASPPAPAITVPVPAPQLSGHAPRRAGETQSKRS